jgi:hypothetical protein
MSSATSTISTSSYSSSLLLPEGLAMTPLPLPNIYKTSSEDLLLYGGGGGGQVETVARDAHHETMS